MAQVGGIVEGKLYAPLGFSFYDRPYLLNSEGEELGPLAEGSIATPDIKALRTALLRVRTTRELARWLNQASYITTERTRWTPKRITEALKSRFFGLRDILGEWLVQTPVDELMRRGFPSELVNEVCWTTSSSTSAEAVFARATVTITGLILPMFSPRQALILSTHVDLFWSGYKFRRCLKCQKIFPPNRNDQKFCTERCKRAAGSLRYYHRVKDAGAGRA